ncbi:putative B3 domain-containing protein REM15 isoform X1 [Macadamia integrifolia]|uniref:putative B3 domain-containing protein REM15 isoform X1 n=1 Tax=Macadamia integrifolia TaxID=60698 RepID=UPI001C4ED299|nr:putative B3 domain-containing protein REM15 isoform X1 [Macadamia integrifolia]
MSGNVTSGSGEAGSSDSSAFRRQSNPPKCEYLQKNTIFMASKIRPRNPQFFKPILPGFLQQLAIPIEFRKHLREEKCEDGEAVLRNCGKSWPVKVSGFCFKEGWADFARDRHLLAGDFLIFRYEGQMVFDVMVFTRSACEKIFPPFLAENENKGEGSVQRTRPRAHKADSSKGTNPFFVVPVGKFNLMKNVLVIPRTFARSNGLIGEGFEMILKDQESGRSWPVQLRHKNDGRVYFRGGLRDFAVANHLKKDQLCIFRLICSSNNNDGKMVLHVTVDHKASGGKPSFMTSLNSTILERSVLYVPRKFARKNDLEGKMNHKTTLKDQKGRTWELELKPKDTKGQVYIRGDWHEITVVNGLEEGDAIYLQLTTNDAMDTMEFLLL